MSTTLIPEREPRLDEMLFWSIQHASRATSLSRSTIKALLKNGTLVGHRVGGRVLLIPDEVRQALASG